MESTIVSTIKNELLKRDELVIEITSDAAPRTVDVISCVESDESCVVVRKIHTNFGKSTFSADVLVYASAKDKERVEVIPKKIKKKMEEEKKAAEEAAQKAAEEARKAKEEAAAQTVEEEDVVVDSADEDSSKDAKTEESA